ncbi:hypothetical protein [Chitinophaga eiseniae]|uniref:Outer membrane protein beta-barrel domain-containing protein n=1 Tax=Chitinophaga eiseniae TaxID=634771 RepID=A0A847SR61_9BACT|nr:hypothetical protein [Chitinophaga eiseniae]NLR82583.1 hypothetical protein [Chitinophaga eiseniae]
MKKMLLLAGLLVGMKYTYAQVVRLNVGITSSSLKLQHLNLDGKHLVAPSIMAGVEYLHKKWFYLSSEIGYTAIGDRYDLIGGSDNRLVYWDFAQLNTTFRARHVSSSGRTEFFAGAGAYVNILLNDNGHTMYKNADYDTRTFNTGIKTEAGIVRDINRFRVGLTGTYLLPLSSLATTPYARMDYRAWSISLGLGYKLH